MAESFASFPKRPIARRIAKLPNGSRAAPRRARAAPMLLEPAANGVRTTKDAVLVRVEGTPKKSSARTLLPVGDSPKKLRPQLLRSLQPQVAAQNPAGRLAGPAPGAIRSAIAPLALPPGPQDRPVH